MIAALLTFAFLSGAGTFFVAYDRRGLWATVMMGLMTMSAIGAVVALEVHLG